MKRIAIVAAAVVIGTPALAADMAVKAPPMVAPPPSWTGFYLGANVGGVWTHTWDVEPAPISGRF